MRKAQQCLGGDDSRRVQQGKEVLAYLKEAKGIKKLAMHWIAQPALNKLVLAFLEVIRSWTMGEMGRMPF